MVAQMDRVRELEIRLVYAELRAIEAELNGLRQEQNAWAVLLMCCRQGIEVEGMAGLSIERCRRRILECQGRVTRLLAQAQGHADKVGMVARVTRGDGGRVQVRLDVV